MLEELGFEWREEPMREFDLESCAKLCRSLDIPILAAECTDGVGTRQSSSCPPAWSEWAGRSISRIEKPAVVTLA